MNHLTDDQLSEWLAGESTAETRSHFDACPQCRDEAGALHDGIARYSFSLREQARHAQAAHLVSIDPKKTLAAHRLRWAAAAALALLLAAPTAWMMRPHVTPAPLLPVAGNSSASQPSTGMSDDELLEAVNNDLNRDVPQALAPISAITVARNAAASALAATNTNASAKEVRR
jgi:hypothetical protein